jgi:hypothetical protein
MMQVLDILAAHPSPLISSRQARATLRETSLPGHSSIAPQSLRETRGHPGSDPDDRDVPGSLRRMHIRKSKHRLSSSHQPFAPPLPTQ